MKGFVIRIIIFLSPLFIIGIAMEIFLRSMPNDYKSKNHYIETHASQINTLILGSSHAFRSLNPKYLDDYGFNLSNISQTLDIDYKIFEKYKVKLYNLKNLIIPISYFTYYNQLKESTESWRGKNYILYYDIDIDSNLRYNFEVLSNNFDVNIKRILDHLFKKDKITTNKLGFGPFEEKHKPNIDWYEDARAATKRHKARNTRHLHEHLYYLNQIIEYCESSDIKVILISLPVYDTYLACMDRKQYQATISMSDSIASTHTNTTYINKFADKFFNQNDFYNSDHLNQEGSKKLSLILSKQLQ